MPSIFCRNNRLKQRYSQFNDHNYKETYVIKPQIEITHLHYCIFGFLLSNNFNCCFYCTSLFIEYHKRILGQSIKIELPFCTDFFPAIIYFQTTIKSDAVMLKKSIYKHKCYQVYCNHYSNYSLLVKKLLRKLNMFQINISETSPSCFLFVTVCI